MPAFRGTDAAVKEKLVNELGEACRDKGFFQLVGHGIDADLQHRTFAAAKQFFNLPLEDKLRAKFVPGKSRRGYEMIGGQMLEPGAAPDTKEGIYLGENLSADHPRVVAGYGAAARMSGLNARVRSGTIPVWSTSVLWSV